jgi:hypothetical protein
VCRNGHVITDLLLGYPERGLAHCDRCGAATLDHCPTCGREIPGAVYVPGLTPAGSRPAPNYCAACGAPFPWNKARPSISSDPAAALETILRRLPLMIRELRSRHGFRPVFSIEDEHDLADLLRAVLSLHFGSIRLEGRTPRYASDQRTDLLLAEEGIAVSAKLAGSRIRERELEEQLREDADYYRGRRDCAMLVGFIYDPEGLLREPSALERAWSSHGDDLELCCIIAGG